MQRKPLTNESERRVYDKLMLGLDRSRYHISKKVGVKDVIDASDDEVSSWPDQRRRIWWWGHFDFVCTLQDSDVVQFVVEFDGEGHFGPTSEARDRAKNTLCRDAGLPILRISQDNILKEFEHVSVVEWIASLFAAWKKERNEWNRWWTEIASSDPEREGPGPRFYFQAAHPFPPRVDAMDRLLHILHGLRTNAASPNTIDFSTHSGGTDANRVAHCGVVYQEPHDTTTVRFCGEQVAGAGISRLFSTQKKITFTWLLPVDDENYDVVSGIEIPRHRPAWSELPGVCIPRVMEEVAEYLVLLDIEKWAKKKLADGSLQTIT